MTKNVLLPVRHPNSDFFIADIFDSLPVKDSRQTLEHPFFALSTKKSIETIKYEHDGVEIKLSPSAEFGLPTMMDKDILLYCGSIIMSKVNKMDKQLDPLVIQAIEKERQRLKLNNKDLTANELEDYLEDYKLDYKQQLRLLHPVPKTLHFSCHDLMITTNRMTNGQAYAGLKSAFERLAGCLITTNIKTNKIENDRGFHLIERYDIIKNSHNNSRMTHVEVTLSDWYYDSLVSGEVLTINRDYFRLRKPLERRLYELARKFCGYQSKWTIGLENLKKKCGSRSDLNYFRYQINQIIKNITQKNHFPDYFMEIDENDKVTFKNSKKISSQKDLIDMPYIKPETIAKARSIVEEAGTGWDFDAIHGQFTLQLVEGFKPESADGAFIGFVKKKVASAP